MTILRRRKWDRVFKELIEKLVDSQTAKPKVNYLIVYLFAGHGIQKGGLQSLLLNEFDPRTKFYKFFNAEAKIRVLAK